ncbi:MAG: flagellar biosynthetic protein FliQ [Lachnospiraceae bacterium]|nr:flagellar biosynthetic protein FliQ [Lachnospiraceae bacterium]
MLSSYVIDVTREVVWTVVKTAAPLLLVSLVIGLCISVFQTITSIQEQTLTFVPKFLAIMAVIILFGSWIMNNVSGLLVSIMNQVPALIKR